MADTKQVEPAPWAGFANPAVAAKTKAEQLKPGLAVLTAEKLGFEFDRKDGNGQKKSLNTTVMSGRADATDPRSAIVFYRSHLGGFGDLLTKCLMLREPNNRNLIIQSDFATVNLINDPKVKETFNIRYAGCVSHARRPFAIHENDDPDLCGYMLHLFKGFYIHERCLDLHDRNLENVKAVRGEDSRWVWEQIKDLAQIISKNGQKVPI